MMIESLCSQYRYLLALDSKQVLTNFYDLNVSVLQHKINFKKQYVSIDAYKMTRKIQLWKRLKSPRMQEIKWKI